MWPKAQQLLTLLLIMAVSNYFQLPYVYAYICVYMYINTFVCTCVYTYVHMCVYETPI